MSSYVFIMGVARSGTTSLVTMLNAHPDVCLGNERYTKLAQRGELTPEHFKHERFFDFRSEDTNSLPDFQKGGGLATQYRDLDNKWNTAHYFGDKVPHLFREMPSVAANFPKSKFILIHRNIYDVALSWQKRADDISDHWPAKNNYKSAVQAWNQCVDFMSSSQAAKIDMLVLSYEDFFDGQSSQWEGLLDFLDLSEHSDLRAIFKRRVEKYQNNIKNKKRNLAVDMKMYIDRNSKPFPDFNVQITSS